MREKVPTPPGMSEPRGTYSYAVKTSGHATLYVAGLGGLDDQGKVVAAGDMGAQSARAFDRLEAILGQAGATLRDVVRLTTYVTTFDGLEAHTAEVQRRFGGEYPPATLLMVKALPREGMLIEIEATAVVD